MSSHHFVREEQATALYINGNQIEESLLMQLLEWNPTIIVNGRVLEWVNSLNIKFDVLVSDADLSNEIPYAFLQWESGEDLTILQKIKKEVKAARVIIVGESDIESMHQLMLAYPEDNFALYENNFKHFVLKKGATFKKWVNAGFEFRVSSMKGIKVDGVVERGPINYKTQKDGIITINSLSNLIISEAL